MFSLFLSIYTPTRVCTRGAGCSASRAAVPFQAGSLLSLVPAGFIRRGRLLQPTQKPRTEPATISRSPKRRLPYTDRLAATTLADCGGQAQTSRQNCRRVVPTIRQRLRI